MTPEEEVENALCEITQLVMAEQQNRKATQENWRVYAMKLLLVIPTKEKFNENKGKINDNILFGFTPQDQKIYHAEINATIMNTDQVNALRKGKYQLCRRLKSYFDKLKSLMFDKGEFDIFNEVNLQELMLTTPKSTTSSNNNSVIKEIKNDDGLEETQLTVIKKKINYAEDDEDNYDNDEQIKNAGNLNRHNGHKYQNMDRENTNELYITPDSLTNHIINILQTKYGVKDNHIIYEPCCGTGAMVDAFNNSGYNNVVSKDLYTTDIKEDFLASTFVDYDILVTNPPFSCKGAFIFKCIELGKPFALLLPLQVLTTRYCFENLKGCSFEVGLFCGANKGFVNAFSGKDTHIGELCVLFGLFESITDSNINDGFKMFIMNPK